jgi:hypothetical protein
MKKQNRISQLTLELYYRGLATNKERRLVENALATDSDVRRRYEALQESEREIRKLVTRELNRLDMAEVSASPSPKKKRAAVFILAAAVLLCALIPVILYLKNSGSNKDNVITEETTHELNSEEPDFIEDVPNVEIADPSPSEPQVIRERSVSNSRTEIAETPRTEPVRSAEPELRLEPGTAAEAEGRGSPPARGVSVAIEQPPDTGIRMRGQDQPAEPSVTTTVPEVHSNINIPPGITFIFDNMFANSGLTFVVIPSRITSIGRNAFQGNPLLSVTIGANVSIEDSAIPGNFAAVYNAGGKAAGTYTRPDINSEAWEKR